jgi:hypothetical protein
VGCHKCHTDVVYQEIFYDPYNQKFLINPKEWLLIIASFVDFDFVNPNCEVIRIFCLPRNITSLSLIS